jgi:hypothetical protein
MPSLPPPNGGYDRIFYAHIFDDNAIDTNYQVYAVQLAETDRCIIYADYYHLSTETKKAAEDSAKEFEDVIYPRITEVFGVPSDIDGNGKIIILFLDILDGMQAGSDSFLAGYFDPNDMNLQNYSNKMELLYIDIAEGKPGSDSFNATIAHEFQHLLRYSAYLQGNHLYPESWLNEGLSMAAEHIYLGEPLYDWVAYFNRSSKIAQGNNFFVWESDLADYSTVYLFFQWLRIQAAKTDDAFSIYKKICDSPYGDYRALVTAVQELIDPSLDTWEKILRTWLAANCMDAPKDASDGLSLYGYKGEFKDTKISIQPYKNGGKTVLLLPGEGVYSAIPKTGSYTIPGVSGDHVGYAGLSKATQPLFSTADKKYSGEYLLTYNNNSTISKFSETGSITGVSAQVSEPRAVSELSTPLRIDGLLPIR